MKRFILIMLLAIIMTALSVFAIDTQIYEVTQMYEVGKTPLKVLKLPGSDKVHIFCAGDDMNYDDEIGPEEEAPSWWVLESVNSAPRKVLDFDRFFKSRPFRPALDPATNMMYIPLVGKIVSIDLNAEEMDDDMVAEIDAQSINFAGGHLLITVSPGMGEIGRLDVLNLQTNQILQTVEGGVNIMDCIYYPGQQGISIAILNQGDFGTNESNVMYGAINHMFDFELDQKIEVGNAANHIIHHRGKLYVTVTNSHWIKVINLATDEVETWHTGTTGWNGPRESVVKDDRLYVTTFAGDVREFDLNTGLLINLYESGYGDKIENIAFHGDETFFSANPYDEYYTPENAVSYWEKAEDEMYQMLHTVTVGKAPVGLINTATALHVFCMGDEDSNELPSWWTVTRNGSDYESKKQYEFNEGDIRWPFRPAINPQSRKLYIPAEGVIKSYNIDDFSLDDDMVAQYDAVALDMAGTHLMAAVRYEDRADSIVVINLQTGTVLQKVYAGNHVEDVKYYPLFKAGSQQPEISLAILTHENEEGENTKLLYGPISHMADFSLEYEANVGQGGFGIGVLHSNLLGVVSLISGEMYAVNAENHEVTSINIGTNDAEAPLCIAPVRGVGSLIGTSAGDLRPVTIDIDTEFDIFSLSLNPFMKLGNPIGSATASVNLMQGTLFVAATGPLTVDANFNDEVYFITNQPSSVRNYANGDIASIRLYPNPANEYLTIETELRENNSGIINMEIVSMTGAKVASFNVAASAQLNHTINLRDLGLSSGTYILNIINGKEVKSLPFSVVR